MTVLSTGTVTFLFTDIEGSTQLLKHLGRARYGELLADQQRLLRETWEAHRGEEVDTQGDQFFVAFRSASDAVEAAVAAQRALAAHPWPDGVEVRVRIGIHSGEALATGERYLGLSVHRAARVGATAHGGQVLLSSSTRELVEDDMPDGVFLRDLGQVRLKDIDRPERIAQLTADGLQLEFPPLRDAVVLPAASEPPPLLRRRSLLAAVAAGVLAAAVAIPVFALAGGSGVSLSKSDSLVQIDPDQAKPVESIKVPDNAVGVADNAVGVATCLAFVFVPTLNGTVYEINPQTSKPYPIHVNGTPGAITNVDALAAVVTRPPTNSVSIIDAADAKITTSFPLPGTPSALAALTYWGRVIWIANPNTHELERVGYPYTAISTDKSIELPVLGPQTGPASRYEGVAGGAKSLWVSGNASNHTVWRVNPATRRVTPIHLPFAPSALTFGPGGVWVVDRQDNAVVPIDPATNRPGQKIAVGRDPISIAAGDQFVWVANKISGTVTRIDPTHGTKTSIDVGTNPIDVVYGLGSVWVAKRTS